MNYRIIVYFILLSILADNAMAQQVIFKTYTKQDGLVANPVRRIMQDSQGFMWIATWEGLSKYDGHRFTNYNTSNGLSFDLINDIYEDKDNRIYIAHNNGSIDVLYNNKIEKLSKDSIIINRFYTPDPVHKHGAVFAITDNKGILQLQNGRLYTKPQQFKDILDIVFINDSLKLVFNSNLKPSILDGNMNIYSKKEPVSYSSIATDSKKNIWLCGYNGIKLLNPVQKRNEPISYLPLPPLFRHPLIAGNKSILDLFEDADGNYWLSSSHGLIRLSPDGKVQLFTIENGLPVNYVNNLYQDKEKNIWMASELGLVKLVMKNDFRFFTNEDGLETDDVYSLASLKSQGLYVNNVKRIFKLNENDFTFRSIGKNGNYTMLTYTPNYGVLTIRDGGLWKINESGNDLIPVYIPESKFDIHCVSVDAQGNYFLGTHNGLIVKTSTKIIKHPSLQYRITALSFDRNGYLWAGTWYEGLFRLKINYHPDSLSFITENISALLADNNVRSSFADAKGNIWIGTRYRGAFRFSASSEKIAAPLHFSQKDGLSSNWVNTFAEDENGNIWVGTDGGLNKLVPEKNNYRVFDFNRLNNFFGEIRSIQPAPGNVIWCGGIPGLIRFKDEQLDTLPGPVIHLTTIKTGRSQDPFAEPLSKKLFLPYRENRIHFEFSSPSFINEKSIQYSYRLTGDPAWSIPSNEHSISYASLQPGDYTFEVRAYGWNQQPGKIEKFSFTIKPPFWQAWWFYLSCVALLALLFYSIYRYRINQLLRLQKVRNAIATDLHDDIGSTLTNISILSELSKKNLGQPQQAKIYLERINEEVSSSGQALDDIIWNVNSKNDTMEEMLIRMRRFAAELFEDTPTSYYLELDPASAGKRLSMEQRRDIYLVFKEALNNIFKHAEAKNVWVQLSVVDRSIKLMIRDDGKGFNPRDPTHRNGLNNIQKRVEKWNGRMKISSASKKGADIEVIMPFDS